jgi:hypothetical protein
MLGTVTQSFSYLHSTPQPFKFGMTPTSYESDYYFFNQELIQISMLPFNIGSRGGKKPAPTPNDDTYRQPKSHELTNDGMRHEPSQMVTQASDVHHESKAEESLTDRKHKPRYNNLETKYDKLKKEYICQETRYKTQNEQHKTLSGAHVTLTRRYNDLEKNYDYLKKTYHDQKEQHKAQTLELNDKTKLIDCLTQEIKDIQEEDSKLLVEKWAYKLDSQLGDDIDHLRKRIASWSRKLTVDTIDELREKDQPAAEKLKERLCEIVPTLVGGELPVGLAKKGARTQMIVTAVLSHELSFKIIGDPFFFLERKAGDDDQDNSIDGTCITLKTINAMASYKGKAPLPTHSQQLRLTLPDQEHHVHIWRSDVLRGMKSEHDAKWKDACQQKMRAFHEHPVNKLIQARNASSESELEDIFVHAGKLSYDLWTRRSKVEVWGMSQLRSGSEGLGIGIDIDDLQEHGLAILSNLHDSNWGDALVCVHPLIRVFGREEATHYTESRTLLEAEVWA